MARQIVMDTTGDTRHEFDPADPAALAEAERRLKLKKIVNDQNRPLDISQPSHSKREAGGLSIVGGIPECVLPQPSARFQASRTRLPLWAAELMTILGGVRNNRLAQ